MLLLLSQVGKTLGQPASGTWVRALGEGTCTPWRFGLLIIHTQMLAFTYAKLGYIGNKRIRRKKYKTPDLPLNTTPPLIPDPRKVLVHNPGKLVYFPSVYSYKTEILLKHS